MEVSRLEQPEQGAEEGGGASEKKNIEKTKGDGSSDRKNN